MNVIRIVTPANDRQLTRDEAPALVVGDGRVVLPDPAKDGVPQEGTRFEFIADDAEAELTVLCPQGSSVRIINGSGEIKNSTWFTVPAGRWVVATLADGRWLVTQVGPA